MKNKIIIALILILTLTFSFKVFYKSDTLVLKSIEDGKIHELKIDKVIDENKKYKKGQKYKVTYHFIFGKMFKRNIELSK
ncbi:MAG: hypothetical protein ACQEQF_00715 [Bacillota bacterium]